MALDPLEKEQLRRKMAVRMDSFLEGGQTVSCVSGHYYDEPHRCELCSLSHTSDILVIKNRSGKKLQVASACLREMVRFRVTDVDDLPRWIAKLSELKTEAERRRKERAELREEERKRLRKSHRA